MVFQFARTIPFLFGPGAAGMLTEKAKEYGLKKVFFVYDKGVQQAGIAPRLQNDLAAADIEVVPFDGVVADPPDTLINEVAETARAANVDGIIAVGGGSTMDAAKAINILMYNEPPISRYFDMSVRQKPGKALILLPTTAGTGSEVTSVSVLSDTATQSKKGIPGPAAEATLAIIDPELTLSMPPHITASTGMDAMSHAVEAYTSTFNNPMSDMLALKAIRLLAQYLPKAVKDGADLEARTNVMFAAAIAGIAINSALVNIGHAIAHTIGSVYHVPHGIGCALALPPIMIDMAEAVPDKMLNIASALGLTLDSGLSPKEKGLAVANAFYALNEELGIPGLAELGVKKEDLGQLVDGVLADICSTSGPTPATPDSVLSMLEDVYRYKTT